MFAPVVLWSLVVPFAAFVLYPPNPCPDVFGYVRTTSGAISGHLTVPNDHSGNYELTVNMSIAAYIDSNENIRIDLLSPIGDLTSGRPIQYRVIFPGRTAVLPVLTEVSINGRVLCNGPKEQLSPGRSVTNMWAKSIFRTSIAAPIAAAQPNVFIPPKTAPVAFTSPPIATTPKAKCGVAKTSQNLIFGGEATGSEEFPWLAAIMYTDGTGYKLKCTGNLISDRHVITAGHCLRYYNAPLIENEDTVVVLGRTNIKNWPLGTTRGISDVRVHPKYEQDSPNSDMVIVVLNEPVSFIPICLWEGGDDLNQIVGRHGTVAGWGADKVGADFSPEPNKVEMPVVSQEQCLRSHRAFRNLTSGNTFCAGNRDGTGPCVGDSGAGLMLNDKTTSRWYLRGLAGFSLTDAAGNLCDLTNYVIFSDVAKETQWIKSVLGS